MNIDPLADKYSPLSPYSYVADNPILLHDPDGKQISITLNRNDEGEITGATIDVVGKLINNSSRNLNDKQLEKRRKRIVKGLNNVKIAGGDDFEIQINAHISIAQSENDISASDHVYRLVDDIAKVPGVPASEPGSDPEGFSKPYQNFVYLENDFTSRTAAHETFHSAGLARHIDESNERSMFPAATGFLRHRARGGDRNAFNTLQRMATSSILTGDDFPKNLMHQGDTRNSKGRLVSGYLITRDQINSIQYKFINGNTNKGQQKSN